jgi:hypothetical protein
MNLHAALWFITGLSAGMTAAWLPWARLMRYIALPAVQAVTWPACGALIVMLSALSVSAMRVHGGPGAALLAATSTGAGVSRRPEVSSGTADSSGAGASTGATIDVSVKPAVVNGTAHGAARLNAMLEKLERRLRGGSADPNDWELLAQAYAYLGRADDASKARQRHIVAAAAMLADADNQLPHIFAAPDEDSADSADTADAAVSAGGAVGADSANVVSRTGESDDAARQ